MVELKKIGRQHRDSMAELLNDEEVSKWLLTVPYPYTPADADEFIERCSQSDENSFLFAIEADGIHVGGIGIRKKDQHSAELGYWIGRKFWNKGYATTAINTITEMGFHKCGLTRIFAYTFEGNDASERVLMKCGYEYEEFLKECKIKNGNFVNCKLYAKIN